MSETPPSFRLWYTSLSWSIFKPAFSMSSATGGEPREGGSKDRQWLVSSIIINYQLRTGHLMKRFSSEEESCECDRLVTAGPVQVKQCFLWIYNRRKNTAAASAVLSGSFWSGSRWSIVLSRLLFSLLLSSSQLASHDRALLQLLKESC